MEHARRIGLAATEFDAVLDAASPGPADRLAVAFGRDEPAAVGEWVGRAAVGDSEAFGRLVEVYQDRVFGFLLRMTGRAEDAEDLAQDTFVKAFVALRRGPPRAFASWLFTIARRTALNHLRARRPLEALADDALEIAQADPAEGAADRDAGERLWRLARRLPPRQFELLWLRYGEGFSIAEVARITGATVVGVKVSLHRCRQRLAHWLSSAEGPAAQRGLCS